MTLPTHTPPQVEAIKQANITWTLMPTPHVAFQMWVDGSIKIVFTADKAAEVIENLRQHLKAFEIAKGMLDNPPKKCVGCRGSGQIMVKNTDNTKEAVVCPKCSGSGRMNFIPPQPEPVRVETVSLPSLTDDETPKVQLPHQTLPQVPDPDALRQVQTLLKGMGYKVVALTKEETAAQLEQTTQSAEHPETERPPSDIPPDSKPALSLEELAALGQASH